MSLRDQLLKVGLITQKQANDVERQHRQVQRSSTRRGDPATPPPRAAARESLAASSAAAAKVARDQALSRQQQDKARRKALLAQVQALIEQHRVAPILSDDWFNFVDGNRIHRIAVDAPLRHSLIQGDVFIVRHKGRHHVVPSAIAARIRERDADAVIAFDAGKTQADAVPLGVEDPYREFSVPDDLRW